MVEALFDSHHSHVYEHREVVRILYIPEEKGVYDNLAHLQQAGDNHTDHHEETVFEESRHGTGVVLGEGVSGNPAVVCDQSREAHNGGGVGVDCKALLSKSIKFLMKDSHPGVAWTFSEAVD